MEDRIISLYLSRIISGYYIFVFGHKKYKLKYPNREIKYEAEIYAQEEFVQNRFVDWPRLDEMPGFLIRQGLWSNEAEKFLETADNTTDNLKVEIFSNFYNPTALPQFRKKLKQHQSLYNKLLIQKHAFDHVSLEGYCELLKNNFILSRSIYDKNNELCFLDGNNDEEFAEVSKYIAQNTIMPYEFRSIARSNQWSYYWSVNKNHLFDTPVVDWTDEQRTLAAMSRMYEGAREHPDCPADEIIEDDDAFDGWAISERRKNEKERSKARAEKMIPGKLNNAHEVFVKVNNNRQAKDIHSLNDNQGKGIINERKQIIKHQGSVKEQNLPDVKRDIIIDSNQKRTQMMRTRK